MTRVLTSQCENSGLAPLAYARGSVGCANGTATVRVCVKTPNIHRFLWSRLAKRLSRSVAGNEPRPQGAVGPDFSHRLVTQTLTIAALCAGICTAQSGGYRAPRAADGKPDINGIWQVLNTANWNLQSHSASAGPLPQLGAMFAIPAGQSVVEGDEIPYLPPALAKKKENAASWWKLDPEIKCYLPGVPRAAYMPYPFQIVQSQKVVMFIYEYASAIRTVNIDSKTEAPVDSWMGWSNGRWEGDTLVIDVTGFNDETWFDRAGNFHSDALHVVERYTPRSPEILDYEATIEDPKVFSRPWKIRMPLYRRMEKNAQLMEYKCPEFAEELLYGPLRKKSAK